MTAPVMVGPSPQGGGPVPALSDIEHAVLEGRANGLTNMAIAGRAKYSYRGIEDAAMRVLRKLGARDMAHAVLLACRAGILDGRPRSQRHGDHPGYTQHQKRGEEACAACKEGERAYQVERRARRRQQEPGGGRLNDA